MRSISVSALLFALVIGCEFDVPSGRFACDLSADCPPGQQCVEGLCVEGDLDAGMRDGGARDGGAVDGGGLDAGERDAGGRDAASEDAAADDAGSTDGGTDAGSDAGTDSGPPGCNPVANDCGPGEYCSASDCGSSGVCMPRPSSTSNVHQPACGCNGVSYWNETHARWLGATAFATGSYLGCASTARTCASSAECLPGTECIIERGLGASTCGTAVAGRCWGIPSTATPAICPGPVTPPDVGYRRCGSSGTECIDVCTARLARNYFTACL
ncbi:hypothetical protein [Sandaracinus amylolyticus]|uniref:Uncharacterized protein n=1 Tax=Sandaracinus amylolyticus TaxID=927083 RepID=A0A0F6YMT3_9BACT|nr:hypothetical protein [Sandaracinus amylolyticus]AKF09628.1 Hypothetical protein DB32_006777 [Sandaracinus amylolyticus]